jgi:hypothetical protein
MKSLLVVVLAFALAVAVDARSRSSSSFRRPTAWTGPPSSAGRMPYPIRRS